MRTAYQDRIRDLLDQHGDEPELAPLSPTGGPLAPEPIKRAPHDALYLKQRYNRDSWSRN